MALSAETSARRWPARSLATIAKPVAPSGARARALTRSTRASGGAPACTENRNFCNGLSRALDFGEDSVYVVAHPSGQSQPGGERVDERAEPDALHHALYPDGSPDPAGHRPSLP